MNGLAAALQTAVDDLRAEGARFALVGGLAVSVRTEPRFTRDVDLAVLVRTDSEAERLVSNLRPRGYLILAIVEQDDAQRLATVRLRTRGAEMEGHVLDLLFASSGLEPEVVEQAEDLEVFPGVRAPVARSGHLIALKVLACDARRPQDLMDLSGLLASADEAELQLAREALELVHARGFDRGKNLQAELEAHLRNFRSDR